MNTLLDTAPAKVYVFNLQMPQQSEAQNPYVSGSTECGTFFNLKYTKG